MDVIDEERYEEAEKLRPSLRVVDKPARKISEQEFSKLMNDMQNPTKAQKEIAVKVKLFLDERIKEEMETKGALSDNTRRWIMDYNSILEKLQKAIYGEKSVNVNITKISHSDIAAKIREED